MQDKWKKLQNGSDIRGVALEGIEGQNVNLTPGVAKVIAQAFAKWLSERQPSVVFLLTARSAKRREHVSTPANHQAVVYFLQFHIN